MKILTISNLYPRPDSPQLGLFNLQLFSGFREQGHEVLNICPFPALNAFKFPSMRKWRDSASTDLNTAYLPYHYVPVLGRNRAWRRCFNALLQDMDSIDRFDPDVVYASWLYPDGCAAVELAVRLKTKVWLMALGSDIFHLKDAVRRAKILGACSKADGIICVAQHLKDALVEAGVPGEKIHVVPNGVDPKMFHPPASCNLDPESRNSVLWVGNLVPVKGPDIMLEVWRELQGAEDSGRWTVDSGRWTVGRGEQEDCLHSSSFKFQVSSFHLVMIGDGPMRKSLERKARSMGIGDSVTFLGALPHAEIAGKMRLAKLLCLTSRSEGMPNVILEALATGLPVVASEAGGIPAMLSDAPACRIVPLGENDVNRFAAAIRSVLDADIDRGALSRKHASRTWDTMAKEILTLIESN